MIERVTMLYVRMKVKRWRERERGLWAERFCDVSCVAVRMVSVDPPKMEVLLRIPRPDM